ncbi:unnamed protein product [Durusdinium trenchii]|uniref:Eukaryotic translation initiation factor 5B n=1 Tax=Durusdinium trenchii TaxID=1381693 RepID=A0ABP0JP36_9DINO
MAMFGEKKKKKKDTGEEKDEKDGKKEKKDKKDKKEKKKRGPTVCEIAEVSAIPKKDKLKLCKVLIAPGIDPVEIVTSAPNVIAGAKFIAAPPGYTTANGVEVKVSKVGGVESAGMFCGPKEMGWDTDVLNGDLAVMLAETAEVGASAPSYEEAVAAFQQREKEEQQKREEEAKASAAASAKEDKKGKKKKGKAEKDDEDLDAILADFKEDAPEKPPETAAAETPKEPKEEEPKGKSASQKKKDKKKGNQKEEPNAEDEFEAALEEFKPEEPTPGVAPEPEDADKAEDEALDAKTLANRKKKEKKKAKQQEKTGGEGMWATSPADQPEQTESKEQASSSKEAASSKDEALSKAAKGKKESAVVKAARERQEQERKLAEERRAFEEAERLRVEEEQRQIEEEERKKEEERQRKRDAKAAKIAKQKAEGTYLTKKQKMQAQRAAQLREQFGYTMERNEDEDAEADGERPQRRPMATKKKKPPRRPQDTEDKPAEEKPEDEPVPTPEDEKVPAKEEPQVEEEDEDDDWEKKLEEEAEESKPKDAVVADEEDESEDEKGSSDSDSDSSSSSDVELRSPVICIMGHVDTGKTKLLDKIRKTNVQEGEAGGITQQIGATFFPDIALQEQTKKVGTDFELEVPGVLIIDTPGHESFNNLRMRGSSLADLAILVIDIMHGLEPQTVESLELLKKRKCPFIIALNKIDILYEWNSKPYTSIQEALERQEQSVRDEFQTRFQNVVLQLNERGLNCNLYWENDDFRTAVSIVPTSALTGEGVPDLLYMILKLTQDLMADKLEVQEELECTVIEVKNIEGLGTTVDVVLLNGTLREGDQIVLAGLGGPIVTTIRALLTPQPMKEMRVKRLCLMCVSPKNEYVTHKQISTSMGIKISAPGLEDAVAGTELLVVGPDDDIEELKEDESILNDFEKEPAGVYVKASTLGSLEALLSFLQDMKIPVFDDKFTKYMEKFRESQKTETRKVAVFPVVLQIDKQHIFRKQDPIILGCQVVGGQLRVGTPLCIPDKGNLAIGHVAGIENNKKSVPKARRGDTVCVKIEQTTAQNHIMFGRHFDHTSQLYSHISRQSIDTLKEHFKDEMIKEDWELIIGMKKVFEIQ